MTPLANLVVLWGGGLLLANVLFDPVFGDMVQAIKSGESPGINTSPVHMILVGLITLLIMTFLSAKSPQAAKTMLWALAGLTVLWLISYQSEVRSGNAQHPFSTTSTTTTSK